MSVYFNPETLEGVSYILYIHPNTGEKSISSWPADGQRTHRRFLEKYPDVRVLSMGTMGYNAKEDIWLPFFENGCDRVRTEEERLAEIAFAADVLHRRYDGEAELKSQLGRKFEEKIKSYEKSLADRKLSRHIINQKIKEQRIRFE